MKDLVSEYKQFIRLVDIFPMYGPGIVTDSSGVTVHRSSNEVMPILYRPFDVRYTCDTKKPPDFIRMPQWKIMRQMRQDNIALVTTRQVEDVFNHCFVTETIVENTLTPGKDGNCYVFPLYLYRDSNVKCANIKSDFKKRLHHRMKISIPIEAEKIFYYVYAVLFSPTYRAKYSRFLQSDFPRIPLPKDDKSFYYMAGLGEMLAHVHLLKSSYLDKKLITLMGGESQPVECVKFFIESSGSGRVYLNDKNYLPDISDAVWTYQMCGYGVLSKRLEGYTGRTMSKKEVKHLSLVIHSLRLTMQYQIRIDELFKQLERPKKVQVPRFINIGFDAMSKEAEMKVGGDIAARIIKMLLNKSLENVPRLNRLKTDEIAESMGMAFYTILNHFNADFEWPMKESLRFLRLTMSAVYMVIYPDTPLSIVANKFGFQSSTYTSQFRKLFNDTPENFRKEWVNPEDKS